MKQEIKESVMQSATAGPNVQDEPTAESRCASAAEAGREQQAGGGSAPSLCSAGLASDKQYSELPIRGYDENGKPYSWLEDFIERNLTNTRSQNSLFDPLSDKYSPPHEWIEIVNPLNYVVEGTRYILNPRLKEQQTQREDKSYLHLQ